MARVSLDGTSTARKENCPLCTDASPKDKGYRGKEMLRHLYLDHDIRYEDVAEIYGCSASTIKNWLSRHDISKPRFEYEMPKDELRHLYLEEERSISDIADHYGCSYLAVHHRLDLYDIPIRSTVEASDADPDNDLFRDEEKLREHYHQKDLSKKAIAEKCGVSEGTIQYWMNRFGIEARSLSDAHTAYHEQRDEKYKDEEVLARLYWEEGLTQREIADKLGCSQMAVKTWMDRHGIELRYAGAHGNTYETERGEFVRSSGERDIANWLYEHDVEYTYEPDLEDADLRPDFRVEGDILEYWGMINRDEYVQRMNEKLSIYEDHGIDLINVYPRHMDNLDEVLDRYLD